MKKISFEKLKSSILEDELNLIEDMHVDKVIDYKEKIERKKYFVDEFNLITNINDLHYVLMGMGWRENEAYERIINHLVEEPKSNKDKFLSLVNETDKDFSKNVKKKFGLNKAINLHMGNQTEEFHAKDWTELKQNLKERFGTGEFRFYNDKRKDHRRIKLFVKFQNKQKTKEIFNYLKTTYPEFNPEYVDVSAYYRSYERFLTRFVTIKCPL